MAQVELLGATEEQQKEVMNNDPAPAAQTPPEAAEAGAGQAGAVDGQGAAADSADGAGNQAPAFHFDGDETAQPEAAPAGDKANAAWAALKREKKELERKLQAIQEQQAAQAANVQPLEPLPPKPTMESCGWDGEKFAQEMTAWFDKKSQHDARLAQHQAEVQSQQQAVQQRVIKYQESAKSLNVDNYKSLESDVVHALSQDQQLMLLHSPKAAELVVALANNPARLSELATMKNPVDFAMRIGELQAKLKGGVASKAPEAPAADKKGPAGGAPIANIDGELERLRAQAERTGDYSGVVAYKKKLKAAERAKR
jgi:hypothetical protein